MDTNLLNRIISDPEVISGQPHIRGTRLSVYNVLRDLAAGRTVEDFLLSHPGMTAEDIYACLQFAAELVDIYYSKKT
jgi:uncharacterized protein (DUF433 family)